MAPSVSRICGHSGAITPENLDTYRTGSAPATQPGIPSAGIGRSSLLLDLRPGVPQGDYPVEHRPVSPGVGLVETEITFALELETRARLGLAQARLDTALRERA